MKSPVLALLPPADSRQPAALYGAAMQAYLDGYLIATQAGRDAPACVLGAIDAVIALCADAAKAEKARVAAIQGYVPSEALHLLAAKIECAILGLKTGA